MMRVGFSVLSTYSNEVEVWFILNATTTTSSFGLDFRLPLLTHTLTSSLTAGGVGPDTIRLTRLLPSITDDVVYCYFFLVFEFDGIKTQQEPSRQRPP